MNENARRSERTGLLRGDKMSNAGANRGRTSRPYLIIVAVVSCITLSVVAGVSAAASGSGQAGERQVPPPEPDGPEWVRADGSLDYDLVPDMVPIADGGEIVGYLPKEIVFGPPPAAGADAASTDLGPVVPQASNPDEPLVLNPTSPVDHADFVPAGGG